MLTACNSSRTTLRMLFSNLFVCSAARMLCTRNSLRLAGGICCSNAHARQCCGSLRFGRKTYCGRFIPRFCGATRRPTHARIRPRSPCRPAGKSSYKGRLWDLGGGSPPMRRRPATRRGWRANRIPLPLWQTEDALCTCDLVCSQCHAPYADNDAHGKYLHFLYSTIYNKRLPFGASGIFA